MTTPANARRIGLISCKPQQSQVLQLMDFVRLVAAPESHVRRQAET